MGMRQLLLILLLFSTSVSIGQPLKKLLQKKAVAAGYDTDAQSFFTVVEGGGDVLTTTHKSAVNQLVLDLKSAGIWTKMKAIYPFVGGTASSHKWNLKNPVDNNAAFRLTFLNSPTHSANGVDWNGTSQYATTYFVPATHLTANSTHMSYYSREDVSSGDFPISMGAGDVPSFTNGLYFLAKVGGSSLWIHRVNASSDIAPAFVGTASTGLITINRTTGSESTLYRNGSSLYTDGSSTGLTVNQIYIGCGSSNNAPVNYDTKQCAYASIGDGFTPTEALAEYTAVQAFQTTLGRQL